MADDGYDPVYVVEQGGERDGDADPPLGLASPDLAAICRGLPGKHKRITTHCAPLDAATGGGFQTGRIVALGGPPSVTKTTWGLSVGYDMARYGTQTPNGNAPVHVHFIAADEPRDGLLSRLGQMEGVARADLDSEDLAVSKPAWEYVAKQLADLQTMSIWDPRFESITVESVAAYASKQAIADGARLVLIIDSIQVAPFSSDVPGVALREKIDARLRELRRISVTHQACVIVISELSRAGYRAEAKADLSSFKESGGIEYTADVAIALARIPDEHAFIVEVTMLKSRQGDTPSFKLRRTDRCTFEPITTPDEQHPTADDIDNVANARIAKLEASIVLALVQARADITSRSQLLELVPGRRQDLQRAVTRLFNARRIERVGRSFKVVSEVSL